MNRRHSVLQIDRKKSSSEGDQQKKYCRWRGSRCWKNACKIKVMHKRISVSIGTTARRWCFSFLRCWCCLWLCWWGRLNVQWIRPIANYQWKYKKAPMLRRPDVAATEVAEEEEEEETAHADDEWNEWILSEGRSFEWTCNEHRTKINWDITHTHRQRQHKDGGVRCGCCCGCCFSWWWWSRRRRGSLTARSTTDDHSSAPFKNTWRNTDTCANNKIINVI